MVIIFHYNLCVVLTNITDYYQKSSVSERVNRNVDFLKEMDILDYSSFSATVDIMVQIADENDNAPFFPNSTYTIQVNESQPINTLINDDITVQDLDSCK